MTTIGFGRVKHAGDEFRNDEALKALDRVIADYCSRARGRRPSYAALAQYLEEREHDAQPLPVRARRLPG